MSSNHQKGRELESVVRTIEELILKSSPTYKNAELKFESNKIVTIDEVRHEIDLYVEVVDKHYPTVFIFECKNRKDPSDKNDIIILSEKIDALSAQKGYFIARQFTSSARAQAKKDKRLELISLNQDFKNLAEGICFVTVCHTIDRISLQLKERGKATHPNPSELNLENAIAIENKQPVAFRDHIEGIINKTILEERQLNQSRFELEGSHKQNTNFALQYTDINELVIDGLDIEYLKLFVDYTVLVCRQTVTSKYEIGKRGRVYKYGPKTFPGHDTEFSIETVQLI